MRSDPAPTPVVLKELLTRFQPPVYRIAAALSGESSIAANVTRKVLGQSLRMHKQWHDEAATIRWFAHHTVLESREAIRRHSFDPGGDILLTLTPNAMFQILLRTLRMLPQQQREAFLLYHGAGFDLRQLATAMDCSTEAAANHLVAATSALSPLTPSLTDFTANLPSLLAQLAPPALMIEHEVVRHLRQAQTKRLLRGVIYLLMILLAVMMIFFGYRAWRILEI